jgi:tRNA threonylcarbamoyladenosine biosynthesis protein TsaE
MPQIVRLRSRGVIETEQIAQSIAKILQAGDALGLNGDLGAGKTVFTRGVCAGFGFDGPVTSPTFTLMHTYPTSPPIHHFDCFRMKRAQEMITTGFDELVSSRESILIVEWAEVIKGYFDDWDFTVHLNFTSETEDSRMMTVTARDANRLSELYRFLVNFQAEAGAA